MLFTDASPSGGFPAVASLPWKADPSTARQGARALLSHDDDFLTELVAWLGNLSAEDEDLLIRYSLERPSHYKWFLGGGIHEYLIWLHQYRSPSEFAGTNRFAASIHDQRLWFCSRVVSGGLDATWYQATPEGGKVHLTATERRRLSPGMVTQMHNDEIHGIDSVEENTVTFLIQGPPERHYSTSFNLTDGSSRRNYDLEGLYPQFISALRARM
jgi:hypothetical protein